MHECTDGSRQCHGAVTTANPVYRCEELEEVTSVYDDIDDNQYDDLNENTIYLDVLDDETTAECDQGNKPELPRARETLYLELISDEDEACDNSNIAQLPSATPVITPRDQMQDQDDDYEALKQNWSDHVSNDAVDENDQDREVRKQD